MTAMRRMRPPSSTGSRHRPTRSRLSEASADRASTCRTTKNRKKPARINGRRICRRGRRRRGSARGRANTVSQIAGYHRSGSAALLGSEHDTPLFISADRSLRRTGVLGSVTHHRGKHVLKAGVEAARLSLHEDFSFFVTDEDEGEEADLSEGVLEHDEDDPFVFRGRAHPTLFALYAQDSIQIRARPDGRFRRPLRSRSHAASKPRSGARGSARRITCRTAARSFAGRSIDSFSRLRRRICCSGRRNRRASCRRSWTRPGGGEELEPERQWATELGVNQALARGLRLDVAYWRRRVRERERSERAVRDDHHRSERDRARRSRRRGRAGRSAAPPRRIRLCQLHQLARREVRAGHRRAVPRRRSDRDCRRHEVHARPRSTPRRRVRASPTITRARDSGRRSAAATKAARRSKSTRTSSTS